MKRRYVIKHEDEEFDQFSGNGSPTFIRCGGGTLFRTKLWARVCRSWFPRHLRDACSIEKIKV